MQTICLLNIAISDNSIDAELALRRGGEAATVDRRETARVMGSSSLPLDADAVTLIRLTAGARSRLKSAEPAAVLPVPHEFWHH